MIWNKSDAITLARVGLRVGFKKCEDRTWTGVLRCKTTVVVECGHRHDNRDQTTRGGTSAHR